jgi:outer membrane protein assembly factor BamD
MQNKTIKSLILILGFSLLSACSSTQDKINDETIGWSAPQLYSAARDNVRSNSWNTASAYLHTIGTRFPYSSYAQQAMIDEAYVLWRDDEPEKAKAVIDRFNRLYPNHPHADYMLYLKGLITFTPPSAFLSSYTGQDPSERDPKGLRESYEAFKQLVERYPQSRYAEDSRLRLNWLINTIAENEVNVAQYYYERYGYVAAINRAQNVLSNFSGVTATERALYIMMMSYEKLGLNDQAQDARRVFMQNYPESVYLEKGLEGDSKWYDFLTPAKWFN